MLCLHRTVVRLSVGVPFGKIRLWNADDFSPRATFDGQNIWEGFTELTSRKTEPPLRPQKATTRSACGMLGAESCRLFCVATRAPHGRLASRRTNTLLTCSTQDSTVRLWDVTAGKERRRFGLEKDGNTAAALSPDAQFVAVGASSFEEGYIIRLSDAASGEERRILRGHTSLIFSLAFSQDSRALISASFDGTARDLERRKWKKHCHIARLRQILGANFSPDSTRAITTGSNDNPVVKVWITGPVTEIAAVGSEGEGISSAFFDSSGRRFLTASSDGKVRVWDSSRRSFR